MCSSSKKKVHSLFLLLSTVLLSCEVINPEEEIPAYIEIKNIDLQVNDPQVKGSNSHNIVDAWVFVDDKSIGAFELPAKIPILEHGEHTLKIAAGIKNDGISSIRSMYPFYDFYITYPHFFPDSVLAIQPAVTYFDETVFSWIEDFEDISVTINKTGESDTTITRISDPEIIFEGAYSGVVSLDEGHTYFKGISNEAFQLPNEGSPVYLELDYSTSCVFRVKLLANSSTGSKEFQVLYIAPTASSGEVKWNKIYVELTHAVAADLTAFSYNIVIEALKENATDQIYLDNIKLLYQ